MFRTSALVALCQLAVVYGQQVGTQMAESHPALTSQQCTASGCTTLQASVTSSTTNCYTGNTWDTSLCADPTTCAANCALDGADYACTYGITSSGSALTLKFVTGANIGSRVYLMADASHYQMFTLLNQEFTFTVDMSHLGCRLNGALYPSEMDADGGMARFPTNKAGAKYGPGCCDSQYPHDLKFINAAANILNWTASATDSNSGTGMYGTCCNEMDIWERRYLGPTTFGVRKKVTPHSCATVGQTQCSDTDCRDGDERYDGVWRWGNQDFLGPGKTVDTTQPFTVVTQFITFHNTTTGTLSEIRRIYVQNGKVIQNSDTNIAGISPPINSITDSLCAAQKEATGDTNSFAAKGGLKAMSAALQKGMVLALSIWDDHEADMLWLDSNYPTDADPSAPGVSRGPCSATSGDPKTVESTEASNYVVFSDIKFGPIGSTFTSTGSGTGTGSGGSTSPTGSSLAKFSQCGGTGWTGSGSCVAGTTCTVLNHFYSQCP
ncbi:major cellobiohydrolase [Mycena vulgaris]|nr:major cellobiohydrolase [Mycena vulgaris]